MKFVLLPAIAIIAIVASSACVSQSYPQTVAKGFFSSISDERQVVIKTQEEWNDFWSELHIGDLEKPKIDFDKEMVIAVTSGEKPSTGYSIEIVNVTETDVITVYVRKTSPPPGIVTGPAFTQPFHVIKIAKTSKDIIFKDAK